MHEIRQKTFKLSTIRLGWRLTGLWPINHQFIMDELPQYDAYESLPIQSWSSSSESEAQSDSTHFWTPKTSDKLRYISKQIDQADSSSTRYRKAVCALQKGAKIVADASAILGGELDRIETVRSVRWAHECVSRQHIKLGGILPPDSARKMVRIEKRMDLMEAQLKVRRQFKNVFIELRKRCRLAGRRLKR